MKKIVAMVAGLMAGILPVVSAPIIKHGELVNLDKRPTRGDVMKMSPKAPAVSSISKNRLKSKLPAGDQGVYGYLGYSDNPQFQVGSYNITADGYTLKWVDPLYSETQLSFTTGWYRDGRVCGFMPYYYLSQLVSVLYLEYDEATGYPVEFMDNDLNSSVYEICAYNESDGYIYGYGFEASTGNWQFLRSPGNDPFAMEVIAELKGTGERQICSALTYNRRDKMLYGVNASNKLVRIAPNGTQTEVMSLSQYAVPYVSGLCYVPSEDVFYWNGTLKAPGMLSEVAYLYKIDTAAKKVTEIFEYENTEQFFFFYTTGGDFAAGTPLAPTNLNVTLSGNGTGASISFTMPATLTGGAAAPATMDYAVYVDGKEEKTGNAASGATVTEPLTTTAEGEHQVTVYALAGNVTGESAATTFYIGMDVPATPANITFTNQQVTWDAVTSGAHGGYIDASAVSYKVYINNVLEGTTTNTVMPVTIATNTPLRAYTAKVVAVCDSKESAPGYSNTIVEGAALQPDVVIVPTSDQAAVCTVVDVNNDERAWMFNPEGYFQSDYNEYMPMDDWLFLPVIDFANKDELYSVAFDACLSSATYNREYLEVFFGTSPAPEAMTTSVMGRFSPASEDYVTYSSLFGIDAPCKGYIGFHACSVADQYGMQVKNIRISKTGITGASPAAPTALKVTGSGTELLTAAVEFVMPTKTVEGNALSGELTAVIESGVQTLELKSTPGAKVNTEIMTGAGLSTITVYAKSGELKGVTATAEVYNGEDVPSPVSGVTAVVAPDMMSVALSWEAVTTGYNGGYINPAKVEYDIYKLTETLMGYNWQLIDHVATCQYTYTAEQGSAQEIAQFGVLAVNTLGDCARIATAEAYLGTPYAIPYNEFFGGSYGPETDPFVIYKPTAAYDTDWGFGDFEEFLGFGDGIGIIGTANKAGALGRLGIPRMTTKYCKNLKGELKLYQGTEAATIRVMAQKYGESEPKVIATAAPIAGGGYVFTDFKFDIPAEYDNASWVQLYIDCTFPTLDSIVAIAGISVTGERTGVETVDASDTQVAVTGHDIVITAPEDKPIHVCTAAGVTICSTVSTGTPVTFSVTPGIYICRVANTVTKVTVK